MDSNSAEVGWTQEQWNQIQSTVANEAQKARIAQQFLPAVGTDDPEVVAIAPLTLTTVADPNAIPGVVSLDRLEVDSNPTLYLSTISILVELTKHEISDPMLAAANVKFQRAANYIARIEDALVLGGPGGAVAGIPNVYRINGPGWPGIVPANPAGRATRLGIRLPTVDGVGLVTAIGQAISGLEGRGNSGPFHCVLSPSFFQLAVTPNANMIMPRDRALPMLGGSLLRASSLAINTGAVIASNGSPIELVVAKDLRVRFLQTTLEPRYVFRVSERIALRIKDMRAIAILST